jgi:hypothetical protein
MNAVSLVKAYKIAHQSEPHHPDGLIANAFKGGVE